VGAQLKLHLDFLEKSSAHRRGFLAISSRRPTSSRAFRLKPRTRAGLDETRPKLFDFLRRIHARPADQRALEKGGAYRYAKP
jgi:glutathione S-transferase